MCGIIGYTGSNQAIPILLAGLKALEYRGYDSAGIAVENGSKIDVRKRADHKASVDNLAADVLGGSITGTCGIAHTRWATHGRVTMANAHPHTSADGSVAIVHNGIIENYLELKRELTAAGYRFRSETDSEVVAHLVAQAIEDGATLTEAAAGAARRVKGAAAVVAVASTEPGVVVGMRRGNAGGIVVGYGEGFNLLASDLIAVLPHTNRIAYLESGEVVTLTPNGACYTDFHGKRLEKTPQVTERTFEAAQKGPYPHFMAKEIAEQPEAVRGAMRERVDFERGLVSLNEFPLSEIEVRELSRVVLVGMGTSLHAAMHGAVQIEALARIPATAENASEFRYRMPAVDSRTLVISITQSGETADTLAGMELAQKSGARLFTLVENEGTQATRLAEYTLPVRAGQEIGVASTKTLTATMVTLLELALHLGALRGSLGHDAVSEAVEALGALPLLAGEVLQDGGHMQKLAAGLASREHLLYLGRGPMYPVAMEGALKMKELAYIHAEGYAAGEMKHGVNALISDKMPTIALAPEGPLYEKMLSNVNEVKARGGPVIALVTKGDSTISGIVDDVIEIPSAPQIILPMLAVIPLQQLAYHTAVHLGLDPDKPRNLAKTVTVE